MFFYWVLHYVDTAIIKTMALIIIIHISFLNQNSQKYIILSKKRLEMAYHVNCSVSAKTWPIFKIWRFVKPKIDGGPARKSFYKACNGQLPIPLIKIIRDNVCHLPTYCVTWESTLVIITAVHFVLLIISAALSAIVPTIYWCWNLWNIARYWI